MKVIKKIREIIGNCYFLGFSTFLISFLTYLKTLAPTIYWGDSGELIAAAHTLGVAHPTGYPTYTLLGKLFTFIPFGNIAWRVNLMSAFFASLAVMLLYFICHKLTKSKLVSFSAALIFAFSSTFWNHAVIAEVYTLNAFFIALNLLILLHWRKAQDNKWLYLFSFTYGLSLTHHLSSVLLLPGFLYLILVKEHISWFKIKWNKDIIKLKIILICAGLGLLGLLPYAYLPIRSAMNPAMDWGNAETVENFIHHVSAKDYQKYFSLAATDIYGGLKSFLTDLYTQFKSVIVLALLALFASLWSSNNGVVKTFLWFVMLVYFAYSLLYQVPDVIAYIIPLILGMVILVSVGFKELLKRLKSRRVKYLFTLLLILIPVILLTLNFSENDLSSTHVPEIYGRNLLDSIEEDNAIVFVMAVDNSFPAWYLQRVEHNKENVCMIEFELIVGKWYIENLPGMCPNTSLPSMEFLIETVRKTGSANATRKEVADFIVSHNLDRPIYFTLNSFDLPDKITKKLVVRDHVFAFNNSGAVYSPISFEYTGLGEPFDAMSREVISKLYIYHGVYLLDNDVQGAMSYFKDATTIEPDSFDAWNNLAVAYYRNGQADAAIEAWEKAISVEKDSSESHYNLALVYYTQGDYKKADIHAREACALDEENEDAKVLLSAISNKLKK